MHPGISIRFALARAPKFGVPAFLLKSRFQMLARKSDAEPYQLVSSNYYTNGFRLVGQFSEFFQVRLNIHPSHFYPFTSFDGICEARPRFVHYGIIITEEFLRAFRDKSLPSARWVIVS